MKKLICILASAALLGACEQKTEVVTPVSPPEKSDKPVDPNTYSRKIRPSSAAAETKTETTTTTTASPSP